MTLRLRPAEPSDAHSLWIWANDAAARAASGHRPVIAWDDHLAWLTDRLGSRAAMILIGETSDLGPVGTIRFETEDDWGRARLSYTVAPERRRLGFGRALLVQGIGLVRRAHPGVVIDALVRPGNEPSLHLFASLGWRSRPAPEGAVVFTQDPRIEDPCRS